MMKQILKKSMALAMLTVLSIGNVLAQNVCEWNGTKFTTIVGALNAGADNVKLLTDVSSSTKLTLPEGATFETNGYNYTGTIVVNSGANLVVCDGTTVNGQVVVYGTMTMSGGEVIANMPSSGSVILESGSVLNISGGEVHGTGCVLNYKNGSTVNMTGGKFITRYEGTGTFPGITNVNKLTSGKDGASVYSFRIKYSDSYIAYITRLENENKAVDANGIYYSSLQKALDDGTAPITMLEDSTLAPTLNLQVSKDLYLNGYEIEGKTVVKSGAHLFINDGDKIDGQIVVEDGGSLVMTGGTVTASQYIGSTSVGAIVAESGSTVEISGGKITGSSYSLNVKTTGTTTVTGGEFIATESKSATGIANYANGTFVKDNYFFKTAGTSGSYCRSYFSQGVARDANDVNYKTLDDALTNGTSPITLIEDYSTSSLQLSGKELKLGGHTLSGNVKVAADAMLDIAEGDSLNGYAIVAGKLNMTGGTVTAEAPSFGSISAESGSTVTISGGNINGNGISLNIKSGSNTTVSGGVFTTTESKYYDNHGIAGKENGTFEKEGLNFVGYRDPKQTDHAMFLEGMVKDAEGTAYATLADGLTGGISPLTLLCDYDANYQVISGKELILNGHNFYVTSVKLTNGAKLTIGEGDVVQGQVAVTSGCKMDMTGGTINYNPEDYSTAYGAVIIEANSEVSISGGEINADAYGLNVKSEGTTTFTGGQINITKAKSTTGIVGYDYISIAAPVGQKLYSYSETTSDGTNRHYMFVDCKAAIKETGKGYDTVQEAVDATNAGETVIVQINAIEDPNVESEKTLTIDLNSKSIIGTITNNGTLTLTDTSADKAGKLVGSIINNGTLSIIGGTYTFDPTDYLSESCHAAENADGTWTVHAMTATEAKVATCTEDGNTAYWYCSICNKYFSDAKGLTETTLEATVIEKTGHDFLYKDNEDGSTHTKYCSRGDYSESEEHNFVDGVCTLCGYVKACYSYDEEKKAIVFKKNAVVTTEIVQQAVKDCYVWSDWNPYKYQSGSHAGEYKYNTRTNICILDLREASIAKGVSAQMIRRAAIATNVASKNLLVYVNYDSIPATTSEGDLNIVFYRYETSTGYGPTAEGAEYSREDEGLDVTYCYNYQLCDSTRSDFFVPYEFYAITAEYKRTIGNNVSTGTALKYGTLMLPFEINGRGFPDYKISNRLSWDGSENPITITVPSISNPNIAAYTPVVFENRNDLSDMDIAAYSVLVEAQADTTQNFATDIKNIDTGLSMGSLKGRTLKTWIKGPQSNLYYYGEDVMVQLSDESAINIKPGYAYIELSGPASARSMKSGSSTLPQTIGFKFVDEEEGSTTAVDSVNGNANVTIEGYYSTTGYRSATPMKGINIIRYTNGTTKKIVVE